MDKKTKLKQRLSQLKKKLPGIFGGMLILVLLFGTAAVFQLSIPGTQLLNQPPIQLRQRILFWKTQESVSSGQHMAFPKLPDGPLAYPDHFEGKNGPFAMIINPIETRWEPRIDSETYISLEPSLRVRVIKQEESWAFLASEDGQEALGWIPESEVGFKSRFAKVSVWSDDNFSFCKGNYCAELQVYDTGALIKTWSAQGGGLWLGGVDKGHVFQSGQVFWLKTKDPSLELDFLTFDRQGKLCHEVKYKKSTVVQ